MNVNIYLLFRTRRGIKSKWNICSSNNWDNWICFGICFEYCLISQTLGSVSCTFTTFGSFLWKNCSRTALKWMVRDSNGNNFVLSKEFDRFFNSCLNNSRHNAINGYNGVFSTYIKTSLGRISKQVLQRRWIHVQSF